LPGEVAAYARERRAARKAGRDLGNVWLSRFGLKADLTVRNVGERSGDFAHIGDEPVVYHLGKSGQRAMAKGGMEICPGDNIRKVGKLFFGEIIGKDTVNGGIMRTDVWVVEMGFRKRERSQRVDRRILNGTKPRDVVQATVKGEGVSPHRQVAAVGLNT